VRIYLDSSALVKLVQPEAESDRLRRFLRRHRSDQLLTSALARVEVVRAVFAGGPAAVAQARRQLSRLDQVVLRNDLLDSAATLAPVGQLRSLEAIHLAAALLVSWDLRALVTSDRGMADSARALGLAVETPGDFAAAPRGTSSLCESQKSVAHRVSESCARSSPVHHRPGSQSAFSDAALQGRKVNSGGVEFGFGTLAFTPGGAELFDNPRAG